MSFNFHFNAIVWQDDVKELGQFNDFLHEQIESHVGWGSGFFEWTVFSTCFCCSLVVWFGLKRI